MPIYKIVNKVTGDEHEEYFTSYSELQEFLAQNNELTTGVPDQVNITTGQRLSTFKNDDSFKDLLKNIKEKNKGSKMELN